jgi:hypothetical protein
MTPLEKTRERLESKRFSVRKRGMRELLDAGLRDEFIERALAEKDGALIEHAVQWIEPDVPAALLVHMFRKNATPVPQSGIRFYLPYNNCLHAEAEIHAQYAPQRRRIAVGTVEAVGMGYLRSFHSVLLKVIAQDFEVAQTAFERKGAKALSGGIHAFSRGMDGIVYTDLENEWCAESQKVQAALLALHRIDCAVPIERIDSLIDQVEQWAQPGSLLWLRGIKIPMWLRLHGLPDDEFVPAVARWRAQYPNAQFFGMEADLGTACLKRKLFAELDRLLQQEDPFHFYSPVFCHWPLMRYMEEKGVLKIEDRFFGAREYRDRMDWGIAGPPWAEVPGALEKGGFPASA